MTKILTSIAVAAVCAAVAGGLEGRTGLLGAGMGCLISLAMCGASFFILRWTRKAQGWAILAGMLGGVAVSFVILIASVLALARVWTEVLVPASLTALAVYLTYRFIDAFQLSAGPPSASRGSSPAVLGGDRR